MRLADLEKYNPITIQCHDNPDADALASGFGLYMYFKRKGKEVRLIYMGRNQIRKTNLTMMVNNLQIPIEYLEGKVTKLAGLLITVDCQYGAGNVTCLKADAVAVIDHHHAAKELPFSEIRSDLGSCSTLVWDMMKREGFCFEQDLNLCTALYYGLFSDTSQFSEIYHPLDMEMRDNLHFDKGLISQFKYSNLSLEEVKIAGLALLGNIYNQAYRYAIVRTSPCDPNILGLISDFLLQVDKVDVCVVYHVMEDGIKFSVRSCVKKTRADELAANLAGAAGSGGGHSEKAGGFIPIEQYREKRTHISTEEYFMDKMNRFFTRPDSGIQNSAL